MSEQPHAEAPGQPKTDTPRRVAILGASGGIGSALLDQLGQRSGVETIHATYFRSPAAGSLGNISQFGGSTKLHWTALDATDEASVSHWVDTLGEIDWLINAVGFLHGQDMTPEKTVRRFDPAQFEMSMRINCLPTLLLGKYAAPVLRHSECGVFATISARVGSISDNRLGGWYSYRASKAALNMSLKCLAVEWQRRHPSLRVLALHPGTTDTALSAPFQAGVPEGKLFSSAKTARLLIEQLERAPHHPSGRFVAYDGQPIDW